MKTWLILAAALALPCLFIPACKPSSEKPSSPQATTQPRADMGIRAGMTAQEVETILGKPTTVGNTFVTSYGEGPHKLYIYDKRPKGVFYVQFDAKGLVSSTEWKDQ